MIVYLKRILRGQTFSNLAFLIGLLICGMRYHCQLVVLQADISQIFLEIFICQLLFYFFIYIIPFSFFFLKFKVV